MLRRHDNGALLAQPFTPYAHIDRRIAQSQGHLPKPRIQNKLARSKFLAYVSVAWFMLLVTTESAQTRLTGLDVFWYQGELSQDNWNTNHNVDGRDFAFSRASRVGTTGNYYQRYG